MKVLLTLFLFLLGCSTYNLPESEPTHSAYNVKVREQATEVLLPVRNEPAPAAPVVRRVSVAKMRASLDESSSEVGGGIGRGRLGVIGYGSGTGQGFGSGSGSLEGKTPEKASPLAAVDKILESLDLGNLAFNSPELMGAGEVYQIELLLSPTESEEVLATALRGGDSPVESASGIRLAPEMEATLVGSGFDIKAVTPARQAVSRLSRTRWAWDVSPKEKGNHNLHLTLSARIQVEGKDTPYVVKTFSKTIKVEVSCWGTALALIEANLEWFWTGLIVPLVLWVLGRWKKRKKA